MPDDLLSNADTAYVSMQDSRYRAEQELADRYRAFVSEILRLSLGGLAVFSLIYKDGLPKAMECLQLKDYFALSALAMFALSVASALFFLYCASEGLRWYIAGLRCQEALLEGHEGNNAAENEDAKHKRVQAYLNERMKWIDRCRWSKGIAALLLGLGSISVAVAMLPLTHSPTSQSELCQTPAGKKLEVLLNDCCGTGILKN